MKRRTFVLGAGALATAGQAAAQSMAEPAPAPSVAAPATVPAEAAPPAPPSTDAPTAGPPPTPAPTGPPPVPSGAVRVALRTSLGTILIDLYRDKAPITVANFLRYVDQKHYDGAAFYRASRPAKDPDGTWGSIQGGLQNRQRAPLPPIAHESTTRTGLSHLNGTISMTRNAPGTATSDFFIVLGDQTGYDADPSGERDRFGFAAFGRVVDGLEVVKKINLARRSPTAGVGWLKGEMLSPPIPIISARRR
jgi:peptidyl-prolyl cis-trans isomerase A (cyclophilin A)